MQNPGRSQTKGLRLELFHVQTNTSFELPPIPVIRIGKPKDRILPDINIASLPNADYVSRLHAEIHVEEGNYHIVDMGSANGTYLNNIRIEPKKRYPLNPGDKIDLGYGSRVTFLFLNQQPVAHQSDTLLNNPPTVIQIELVANTQQFPMNRLSKFLGLALIAVGIVILAANTQIGIMVRLPGIILCIAGVVLPMWRPTYRNLGWALLATGIAIIIFTGHAFASVSLLIILISCALLVAGYQLFSTGKLWNLSLWSRDW
jgi:hypothetical protein